MPETLAPAKAKAIANKETSSLFRSNMTDQSTALTSDFFKMAHTLSEEALLAVVSAASTKGDVQGLRHFLDYVRTGTAVDMMKSGEALSTNTNETNDKTASNHDFRKLSYAQAFARAVVPSEAWNDDAAEHSDAKLRSVEPFELSADHREFLLEVAQVMSKHNSLDRFFHAVASLVTDKPVVKRLIEAGATNKTDFGSRNRPDKFSTSTSPLDEAFIHQNNAALAAMMESLPEPAVKEWLNRFTNASFHGIGSYVKWFAENVGPGAAEQTQFLDAAEYRLGADACLKIRLGLIEALTRANQDYEVLNQVMGATDSALRKHLASYDPTDPNSWKTAYMVKEGLKCQLLPIVDANTSYLRATSQNVPGEKQTNVFPVLFEAFNVTTTIDLKNFKALCDLLIEHGHGPIKTSPPEQPCSTALHLAAYKAPAQSVVAIMTLLMEYGCDPHAVDDWHKTPAMILNKKNRAEWTLIVKSHTARAEALSAIEAADGGRTARKASKELA